MPRGRHRHSPPLHRLLPPSAIAGVAAVCAVGPWLFSEPWVLRGLAAGAALTAVVGAVVMRRWDASAGRRVADLARGRASDEWRHEERVAELESDLEESRELRTKLEQRLRAKRTELAGLRNEHAALLRRYATAETERATALEGRRLLEIETTTPVGELTAADADADAEAATDGAAGPEGSAGTTSGAAVPEATTATVQAALAASSAASVLYVKANSALDRLAGAAAAGPVTDADTAPSDDSDSDSYDEAIAEAADADVAEAEGATEAPAVAAAGTGTAPAKTAGPVSTADSAPAASGSTKTGPTQAGPAQAGTAPNGTAPNVPAQAGAAAVPNDPTPDDPAPTTPAKGGPVKRTSAKGATRKGSPSPGGPGKGAPRPGGSPKGASAAGGTMTAAPAEDGTRQEGETPGKPGAVGGHDRTAAATTRTQARSTGVGVTSLQSAATRTAPRPEAAPAHAPAPEPDPAHEPAPGSALARSAPPEAVRVQQRPAAEEGPSPTGAAALTPAARPPRPAGHFTVPTAVAVAPAAPVRRPAEEGGFDFFGTEKGAETLEAVQNEDLADVVGPEALALHKAEAESGFRPAGEESRGVGQVIDLTAHDETEQIDLTGLRSAVS